MQLKYSRISIDKWLCLPSSNNTSKPERKGFIHRIHEYNLQLMERIRKRRLQHYVLALVVIVGVFIIIALTIFIGYTSDRTYVALEKVTSSLVPIVGAVIGYYFGSSRNRKRANGKDTTGPTPGTG
ncbi:MAG: hypothetical protein WBZ36_24790 [Candidatus Nitrosopolaris sp.]